MMISRRRFLATLGAVLGSGALLFGSAGLAQRRAGIPALKLEADGRVAHFESAPGERVLMYSNGGAWLADGFAFMPEATPDDMAATVIAALEKCRQRAARES